MNFNATTFENARKYLQIRYNQLLSIGIYVENETEYEDKAIITQYNNDYYSIYLLEQHRGKGYYKDILFGKDMSIITMKDCNISEYLNKNYIDYIEVKPSKAYQLICKHYGDKCAKRSKVPLINHINEGLRILSEIGASQDVLDAYCLHPIFQSNEAYDYIYNTQRYSKFIKKHISLRVLLLTIEYRRVANSYLSNMSIDNFVGFPNDNIKEMLLADKLQNYKDFLLYHKDTHERSKELTEYFNNWLHILLKDYEYVTKEFSFYNSLKSKS